MTVTGKPSESRTMNYTESFLSNTTFMTELKKVRDDAFRRIVELLDVLDYFEILSIVDMYLPWNRIGTGNTRAVFAISEDFVLKAPIDRTGLQETEQERVVYKEAVELGLEEHLVKTYYDQDGIVIQERLNVFRSANEFSRYEDSAIRIISELRITSIDFSDLEDDEGLRFDQWGLRKDKLVLLDYGFKE